MTAALAIALLAQRAVTPSLPPGTSPEFAKAVMTVEAHLVEGDQAGAREAVRALPVRQPRLVWTDDEALPSALRAERAEGLAAVLQRWNVIAKDFKPQVAGSGAADITLGFAPVLPDGPDGLPVPTRVDSLVPFHATIGLSRGKPSVPIRPEAMNAEIAYALGRYLGVPNAPLPGSAMYRDSRPDQVPFMPRADDWVLAARNLKLADQVRAAVEAGKPLGLALPAVRLAKERLDLGSIEQGKPLKGTIEAENVGAGTLNYEVVRDCECFQPIPGGQIPAQGRTKVDFTIDTTQYVGRLDKLLLFRSNDPDHPTIELPVTFVSRPAYRLIHPGGERVAVTSGGGTYDYFFFTPPGSPLHVVSTPRWDGMKATVTWEPWSGVLADPDLGEGPLPRTGWRIHVRLPATLPPGRSFGTLTVETDSLRFPRITGSLYVQKGIVADEANLGDLAPGRQGKPPDRSTERSLQDRRRGRGSLPQGDGDQPPCGLGVPDRSGV